MPSKKRSLTDLKIKPKEKKIVSSNELVIFDSIDKKNNEKWTQERSYINKIRPMRMILCAPPNSGKSSIAKNMILHASPEYTKIFVIANGASLEWEDYCDELITVDQLMDENTLSIFTTDVEGQRCLIIDDVEMINCHKKIKEAFSMIFKHISSHYSLSVILNVQNYTMAPNDIRANLNVFCINLNIRDIESISNLGKRVGLSYTQFKKLFTNLRDTIENKQYSYLVIDNTVSSPIPISINFTQKIDLDDIK